MKYFFFTFAFLLTVVTCLTVSAYSQPGSGSGKAGKQDPMNHGVNITRKPHAELTESAIRNGVSGVVRIRITFLKTGELGDVVYASETPSKIMTANGLVKSAIDAAKKIKFEPAVKDGEPVDRTHVIEFAFQT